MIANGDRGEHEGECDLDGRVGTPLSQRSGARDWEIARYMA